MSNGIEASETTAEWVSAAERDRLRQELATEREVSAQLTKGINGLRRELAKYKSAAEAAFRDLAEQEHKASVLQDAAQLLRDRVDELEAQS